MSTCPDAWEHIARLGGNLWWSCTRPGNRFIDAMALTRPQLDHIEEWAIGRGLARRVTAWRVDYFDDELDEERYLFVSTEAEAREESADLEGKPTPFQTLASTNALVERMGQDPGIDAFDFVVCCYAEDHGYDGVFWDEALTPGSLSAPRAGIVASKVTSWTFERLASPPHRR